MNTKGPEMAPSSLPPGAEGKRAGRPVTTGSDGTRPVRFRVSAEQRAQLDAEGERIGVSGDLIAKAATLATLANLSQPAQGREATWAAIFERRGRERAARKAGK